MVKRFEFVHAIFLHNVLIQCLLGVKGQSACPSGLVEFDSSCYLFHNIRSTWTEAKTHCQESAGAILRIESSEENDFIVGEMKSHGMYFIWIDCNAINTDELCYTADNTLTSYESWTTGNPLEILGNCAKVYYGIWYSTVCTEANGVVCEMNIIPPQVKLTKSTPVLSCYVLDDNGQLHVPV
ncbi:snaclec coagulation factor IX/factor X-binding protein subunit A-like [Asterias rubens]|uniref:snaclec coagulation factor IX/factor X-binding protein subunit A-like n=1 Tax=Asterias rubens TaxID=7604 RepID=UPI00145571C3|nr:snaclec coagulation factor IX/factor X-binding protein subunit A-like [Asterias rubens]